ncbi:hypothetical protein ACQPXH_10925 [Nocardia sp. CA-135953]|uniref:hypothetical protein n=1 Tax=Nocardia sp. CA-135953 TaxID=3239978 RepID=UPI003D97C5E6
MTAARPAGGQSQDGSPAVLLTSGDDSATLALTDTGRTTHHQAFTLIGKRRRAMLDGITDDQYLETVRLLEQMAENLAGA